MTKKILSLLLVLCFIVGLLPTMASAAENTRQGDGVIVPFRFRQKGRSVLLFDG